MVGTVYTAPEPGAPAFIKKENVTQARPFLSSRREGYDPITAENGESHENFCAERSTGRIW